MDKKYNKNKWEMKWIFLYTEKYKSIKGSEEKGKSN